ncbi:MAG: hypothetical protein AAGF71_03455 [Pseudomonadota bacterium]
MNRNTSLPSLLTAAALFCFTAVASTASTFAYHTLDPNFTDSGSGLNVGTTAGVDRRVGLRFLAEESGELASLSILLNTTAETLPSTFTLFLFSDSTRPGSPNPIPAPGAMIASGSVTVTRSPTVPTEASVGSLSGTITSGQFYWLVAENTAGPAAAWLGSGLGGTSDLWSSADGQQFEQNFIFPNLAAQVALQDGMAPIPLPAGAWALLASLATLGVVKAKTVRRETSAT